MSITTKVSDLTAQNFSKLKQDLSTLKSRNDALLERNKSLQEQYDNLLIQRVNKKPILDNLEVKKAIETNKKNHKQVIDFLNAIQKDLRSITDSLAKSEFKKKRWFFRVYNTLPKQTL